MIEIYACRVRDGETRETYAKRLPAQWLEAWRARHGNGRHELTACQSLAGLGLLWYGGGAGELVYGENGRPFLRGADLDFNIAHTADAVFCAIARGEGARVGIDAEASERAGRLDRVQFSERWFCEEELRTYREDPTAERFLRIWTRKEAAVKYSGRGMQDLHLTDTVRMEREGRVQFVEYRTQEMTVTVCCAPEEAVAQEILWVEEV